MPSDDYLTLLDDRATELLAHGTPATYPTSLAASTELALDRLSAQSPDALDLLLLAAHLAPEPIPFTLFTAHADRLPQPVAVAAGDSLAFADLTRLLRHRGLARVKPGTLQLHRLLQAILRSHPAQHDMPTLAIRLLRAAVPDDPWPTTWPAWRQLLPHVLAVTEPRRTPGPTDDDDIAWLLNCAGSYLLTRGEPAPARPLFERALEMRRSALGEDHPDTLTSANNLATDLRRVGQHEQARQLNQDTLARSRQLLGDDHPNTLRSAGSLAADLRALARDDEASELEEWARSRQS